jgi:two-component system sensor histidine kinase UhpB
MPKSHKTQEPLRILIVEDLESDADLMQYELQSAGIGFTARRVETREDFTRTLEEFCPDLILADYSLPSFDGMSALGITRRRMPELPFIFVSGAMGEERAIELLREGATDYILKDRLSRLPSAVLRAMRDVQERKQRKAMEKKLRDSEEKYRSLVESTDDSIYMLDPSGVYLFANEKYLSRIGLSPEEVIGRPYGSFHTGRQEEELLSKLPQVIDSGSSIQVEDSGAGDNRYYLRTLSPVRDPETGKVVSVTVISKDITERKYAEDVLKQAHSELEKTNLKLQSEIMKRDQTEKILQGYHEKLRSMTSELTLAEERERQRLATELHERIGQTLAISKLKLEVLREGTQGIQTEPLNQILQLVESAIQDTRSITRELSSPVLHQFGFPAAVEWLTEQIQERYGIPVSLSIEERVQVPEYDFQILLYQATRELLMNSIKHAKASRIQVNLGMSQEKIRIQVKDDGVGFTYKSESPESSEKGFGLFSIRERLTHIGGAMSIESNSGEGVCTTLSAPLHKSNKRRRASDRVLI